MDLEMPRQVKKIIHFLIVEIECQQIAGGKLFFLLLSLGKPQKSYLFNGRAFKGGGPGGG